MNKVKGGMGDRFEDNKGMSGERKRLGRRERVKKRMGMGRVMSELWGEGKGR